MEAYSLMHTKSSFIAILLIMHYALIITAAAIPTNQMKKANDLSFTAI
jgi:hypothetical protein